MAKNTKTKAQPLHVMSLSEFAAVKDMPAVNKRGFKLWLQESRGGIGAHTLKQWETLYANFLKS